MTTIISPFYDEIAEQYQASKRLPFRIYIEEYTLFKLLGDLEGKKILDLGCGEGVYTRKIKQRGAAEVVGVDISPRMIELAQAQERNWSLGCQYKVADVAELGKIGEFDIVLGVYFLNYAKSAEELTKFCQAIRANLRPNGRFVGFNDNPMNAVENYGRYAQYGFLKSTAPTRVEGSPITYHMKNPDGAVFSFTSYHLSSKTYSTVFQKTGFTYFMWCGPWLAQKGAQRFEAGYWDAYFNNPPMIGMLASI